MGPLPTLTEQDVAHVRSLSIKDMQAGDELAYFLKPFKGLVTLELDRNQLTRLPEVLSHMPNLEHLSLDGNQIQLTEHTLRKLADMHNLRTLGLSGNRLGATIDVSKMLDLQELFLRRYSRDGTACRAFPFAVSGLRGPARKPDQWNCRNGCFNSLERFALAINLRHNPDIRASRTRLADLP